MADAQNIGAVLQQILRVLERIETKLDKQNEPFEQPKPLFAAINQSKNAKGPDLTEDSILSEISHNHGAEGTQPCASGIGLSSARNGLHPETIAETDIPVHSVEQPRGAFKIPYSCWGFGQQDSEADEGFREKLQKHFGDFWKIPQDNRLPLNIIKNGNRHRGDYGQSQATTHRVSIYDFESRLALFSQFDATLRSHKGNDFLVIDFDSANNSRLYRLGEKAVGDELMVPAEGPESASWSRLM